MGVCCLGERDPDVWGHKDLNCLQLVVEDEGGGHVVPGPPPATCFAPHCSTQPPPCVPPYLPTFPERQLSMQVAAATLARSRSRGPRSGGDSPTERPRATAPKAPRADDTAVDVSRAERHPGGDPLSRGHRMNVGRGDGQASQYAQAVRTDGLLPCLASPARARRSCSTVVRKADAG